jgi:hypothetical protein
MIIKNKKCEKNENKKNGKNCLTTNLGIILVGSQ